MANFRTTFIETDRYGGKSELVCFANSIGDIVITVQDHGLVDESSIHLDISTAIKFAKTLRTEINKAKEVAGE